MAWLVNLLQVTLVPYDLDQSSPHGSGYLAANRALAYALRRAGERDQSCPDSEYVENHCPRHVHDRLGSGSMR